MSREDLDIPKPNSCISCRAISIAAPYAITMYILYTCIHPKRIQGVRDAKILLTIAGGFFILGSYAIFNREIDT